MITVDSVRQSRAGTTTLGWHREQPCTARIVRRNIAGVASNDIGATRERIAVRSCNRASTSVADCFKVTEYVSLREAMIEKRHNFATFRDELLDATTLSVTLAIDLVHRYYLDWLERTFFRFCNGLRIIRLINEQASSSRNPNSVRGFVRFVFSSNVDACRFLHEWTQRQYDYYDHVLFADTSLTFVHTNSISRDSHYRFLERSLDLARSAGIVFSARRPNFDNISVCRLSPYDKWHLPRRIVTVTYNESHIAASGLVMDAFESQAVSRNNEILKKRTMQLSATVLVLITFRGTELSQNTLARLSRTVAPVMMIMVDDSDTEHLLENALFMRDTLHLHGLPVEASIITNQQRLSLHLHGYSQIYRENRAVFEIVESGQDHVGVAGKLKRIFNYECALEERYRREIMMSQSWRMNADTYAGGFVRLVENADRTAVNGVASLDVESLYPSIMRGYNLSPNSVVPSLRYALGGIGLCTNIRLSNESADRSAGVWVDRSKQCCLLSLIKRLLCAKKRYTLKRLRISRRMVKLASNTIYGSLSRDSYGNRFFGMVICSLGRRALLNGLQCYCQRYGNDSVLYCDTDSIFLKLPGTPDNDEASGTAIMSLAEEALDYGNRCISRCMRLPPRSIILKLDFLARVIVFTKMKSYAYTTYNDNKVICRGRTTPDEFEQIVCGNSILKDDWT